MTTFFQIFPIASTSPPKDRFEVIDALRGFALMGIIVAHALQQFLAGPTPNSAGTLNLDLPLDALVTTIGTYLTLGKFFTIFSFLFGLSFAIQMDSAARNGKPFVGRMLWRLALLFVIGFIHSLFYNGDILRIYAILGLPLLLLRRLNNRWLLLLGLFFAFNLWMLSGKVITQFSAFPPPSPEQLQIQAENYAQYLKKVETDFLIKQCGTLGEVVQLNFRNAFRDTMSFQLFSGRLFITLGLFLLGLWAGRQKIFTPSPTHQVFFQQLLWISAIASVVSTAIVVFLGGITVAFGAGLPNWEGILLSLAFDVHQLATAATYLSAITLLFWNTRAPFLHTLVPVGRMGLTNYLSSTAFGALVFLGYGLGQMGKMTITTSVALALCFFGLQILFSNWWMLRYHYGPIEWLWRSLTYLKAQGWRK